MQRRKFIKNTGNKFAVEGSGRRFQVCGTKGSLLAKSGGYYRIYDSINKVVKEIKEEV